MVCHTVILLCSCGEVVTKREQFNDLSIDLPRRKKTLPLRSIQDSLDLFFRVSRLHKQVIVLISFCEWSRLKLVIFLLQVTIPTWNKKASTRYLRFEYIMIEVTFSFCRWRKLSTRVKSAMGKQRLLRINSANCPGIYTQTIESDMRMHHEKLSLIVNTWSWTFQGWAEAHCISNISLVAAQPQ